MPFAVKQLTEVNSYRKVAGKRGRWKDDLSKFKSDNEKNGVRLGEGEGESEGRKRRKSLEFFAGAREYSWNLFS